MSLLETIIRASAEKGSSENPTKFPIVLNANDIFGRLKPENEDSDGGYLLRRMVGWEISEKDSKVIELGNKFIKNLKRKMKKPKLFTRELFLEMLNSFLEKTMSEVGIASSEMKSSDPSYTYLLIEKVGMVVGQSVMSLIVENCVTFDLWELLRTILCGGLITRSSCPDLAEKLVHNHRAELVVLCIQYVPDLQSSDLLFILRYLLSSSRDDLSILSVKREWESKALSHIEKASRKLGHKDSKICLHYLLASSHDGLVLSSAVSGLGPAEILNFLKYLSKWLEKYSRFPEAATRSSSLEQKLEACKWIPSLETVVSALGMVIDQHFLCLVLHPEFHDEIKFMQKVVKNLVVETKLGCSIADVIKSLRLATGAS
ncbi:uncharacterized protein LOC116255371 [Nymphaea colorata]|nr:uncharacterized protein LOC116255371 [Nymphaea colorata]